MNSNSLDVTINRIKKMEQYSDEIIQILEMNPFSIKNNSDIQNKIQILKDYYDNGQWLKDFEADERGELPSDLKRGVLAEDTLYNLFDSLKHIEDIGIDMEGTIVEIDFNNYKIIVNSKENDSVIIFNMCEDIGIFDQERESYSINTLEPGRKVRIRHAEFMTMSMPPQTIAYEITIIKE